MANSEESQNSGLTSEAASKTDPKSAGDGPLVGAKRKSTENSSALPSKKITFGLKKPANQQPSGDVKKNDTKVSMSFGDGKKLVSAPIKLSLGTQKPKDPAPVLKPKSKTVANVFNADDESDEEEMPAEAKMRMKNMGKYTPTAAGPNSFGKGGLGFCDRRKMKERELKKLSEDLGNKN